MIDEGVHHRHGRGREDDPSETGNRTDRRKGRMMVIPLCNNEALGNAICIGAGQVQ